LLSTDVNIDEKNPIIIKIILGMLYIVAYVKKNLYLSFVMIFGLLAHQKHTPKEIE
jgi:hypothetical protein